MKANLITPPVLEPITLAEAKSHIRLDSTSFADSVEVIQSIAPGLKAFVDNWITHAGAAVEVIGYNAIVSFASGVNGAGGTVDVRIQDSDDNITWAPWGTDFVQVTTDGMLTSATLGIGTTLTNVANDLFTYFIAGVEYSKPADAAGTAPGNDVIPIGKYGAVAFDIGADNVIDVIEAAGNGAGTYTTAALAVAGLAAVQAGHVRMGTLTAVKSDGAFIFGTTALNAANTTVAYTQAALKANYNLTYEKAYTGSKRYVRTIAKVLIADCSFGTTIIRSTAAAVDDEDLTAFIQTAREHVEDITRRALLTQTWDYFLPAWPNANFFKMPFGNLQNTAGVEPIISYKNTAGEVTTLTVGTDYLVETNDDKCGMIVLPYGKPWPSTTLYPSNPITIRITCGWVSVATVPQRIKTAIKKLAAKLYESRGEDVLGQTVVEDKTVQRLLASCRLWDEF